MTTDELFNVEYRDIKTTIPYKFLKQGNMAELFKKLKKIKLGSGHEMMTLTEKDEDNYVLQLVTYFGGPVQTVTFNRQKKTRQMIRVIELPPSSELMDVITSLQEYVFVEPVHEQTTELLSPVHKNHTGIIFDNTQMLNTIYVYINAGEGPFRKSIKDFMRDDYGMKPPKIKIFRELSKLLSEIPLSTRTIIVVSK